MPVDPLEVPAAPEKRAANRAASASSIGHVMAARLTGHESCGPSAGVGTRRLMVRLKEEEER
jgi:hypothetical protein